MFRKHLRIFFAVLLQLPTILVLRLHRSNKQLVPLFLRLNNSIRQSFATTTKKESTWRNLQSMALNPSERLALVREQMKEQNIHGIVVPTDDPHMSEYTAEYYNRREFISNFTGSAGSALVLLESAYLFTDGRYHLQAEMELTSDWTLMKEGLNGVPSLLDFIANNLAPSTVIGIDPYVHSAENMANLIKQLESKGIVVKLIEADRHPIDIVWNQSGTRPAKPNAEIRVHPLEYAGETIAEKLAKVRAQLTSNNADSLIVCALDEIMYLFNIRGKDVKCNPVAISYAVVTQNSAHLFISKEKVNAEIAAYLQENQVQIHEYHEVLSFVNNLVSNSRERVLVDLKSTNGVLYNAVPASQRVEKQSPLVLMKAIKNAAELKGMRDCHERDAAAVIEFIAFLEERFSADSTFTISEVEIDEILTRYRAEIAGKFLEPSFDTIAGVNEHGAIIHYKAKPSTCKRLTNQDMLLLDSGGQYFDGTTDVTRTFHFGTPSDYQAEMYTRVLKCHINLDRRVFPTGTPGCFLDSYAREHLWSIGKNYLHGTGHGVGAALNVHEGPQRISPIVWPQGLLAGMVVSNEPGYYESGNFGVRIENLVEIVRREDLGEFNNKHFLGFQKLTVIPIQYKNGLVKLSLMTDDEIAWLNEYHQHIKATVSKYLQSDRARNWLEQATAPIKKN